MQNADKKIQKTKWHFLSSQNVLQKLDASLNGLSSGESALRLSRDGFNELPQENKSRAWAILADQLKDVLVYILLAAAGLAMITGAVRDAVIILFIIFINALVGFLQEYKAERILEKIKTFVTNKTTVIRDGEQREIDARGLAIGDIVLVNAGTRMPADGYILESYSCRVDGFIFSGESRPEERKAGIMPENTALADIENMIFMGESITAGEAKLVIVATGADTELGNLAKLTGTIKDDATPLQKRMKALGKNIAIIATLIGASVMIIGWRFNVPWYENFLIALALAVSAVPEGLPAAISIALAFGMKKLLKNNVLVKRLNAAETLGSITIICTDKTGTITRNELSVTKILSGDKAFSVSGSGYNPEGEFFFEERVINARDIPNGEMLFRIAVLCNSAALEKAGEQFKIAGDPTEGALLVAARKFNSDHEFFTSGLKKINELPFSSERMRMSAAYNSISYVKGSPEILLELATHILDEYGKIQKLSAEKKLELHKYYDLWSEQALRVLAFAYRDLDGVPETNYAEEMEKKLVWVGMMAMIDPPRPGIAQAVAECKSFGVRTIMITGDYALTARAIAKEAGLISGPALSQIAERGMTESATPADQEKYFEVITGSVLSDLTDAELLTKLQARDVVFARISPEQKLRIASVLQSGGEVIAMIGDGVNDAPALKKADIGVAMGIMGTDVSKEAADMILLDDNFSSIVKGVKEGRTIYSNLRKFTHYVFTSNMSEFLTVVFGFILQIPVPISAIQILAIDLGTDILPSFALGMEPTEPTYSNFTRDKKSNPKNILNKKLHALFPQQKVINKDGLRRLFKMGLIMAAGAIIAFVWSLLRNGWHFWETIDTASLMYMQATTATYVTLAFSQMANLFQSRNEKLRLSEIGWFRNKYAWIAFFSSCGILWLFLYAPIFQKYLGMRPIDAYDWIIVLLTTAAVFVFEERRKHKQQSLATV